MTPELSSGNVCAKRMSPNGEARAGLIISGLARADLLEFLPGRRNRNAVTSVAACERTWARQGRWGEVIRQGIGEWAWGTGGPLTRDNAVLFVTWAEVLAVVARGCADGYRERYEAAYRAWREQVSAGAPWYVTPEYLAEAQAALIRYGCEQPEAQGALF